jgi:O-acetyl-ADP-ribose deacetylase (regulator of RNase III)
MKNTLTWPLPLEPVIKLQQDDLLTADAEALVNTVNCVGVMGRGIALQFRKAFPENFEAYKAVCERGGLRPGKLFVHSLGNLTNPRYIINFPTKARVASTTSTRGWKPWCKRFDDSTSTPSRFHH